MLVHYQEMSRIFITGAMGRIGKKILFALAEKHSMVALGYRKEGLKHPSVEWVFGDIRRPETYILALAKCDTLIHLAADVSNNSNDLHATNVNATRELVLSAVQSGCKKIIIFSSAAVTQEYLTPYSRSKLEMEKVLREMNIPIIVVRPTLVYHPGSNYLKGMENYLHLRVPFVPLPNNGNADLRPIHSEDVGKALLAILGKPFPREFRIYDWASEKSFTFREALKLIAQKRGIDKPFVPIPHALLGDAFEFALKFGVKLPLRFIQLAAQGSSYRVDPLPFIRDYGFHFRDPVEGFKACIE